MSHKRNHIERLPPELGYYIAEFIDCKSVKPYPYIPLFKNIILDWYNTHRAWDDSNNVYHHYKEICISQEEIPFLKFAFPRHMRESKYYLLTMNHSVGQFNKIVCRCRNISYNGK